MTSPCARSCSSCWAAAEVVPREGGRAEKEECRNVEPALAVADAAVGVLRTLAEGAKGVRGTGHAPSAPSPTSPSGRRALNAARPSCVARPVALQHAQRPRGRPMALAATDGRRLRGKPGLRRRGRRNPRSACLGLPMPQPGLQRQADSLLRPPRMRGQMACARRGSALVEEPRTAMLRHRWALMQDTRPRRPPRVALATMLTCRAEVDGRTRLRRATESAMRKGAHTPRRMQPGKMRRWRMRRTSTPTRSGHIVPQRRTSGPAGSRNAGRSKPSKGLSGGGVPRAVLGTGSCAERPRRRRATVARNACA